MQLWGDEIPILISDPKDEVLKKIQALENWNPKILPGQNCDWKNAQVYQGKNAGGYSYPKFDGKMFQQNLPANNLDTLNLYCNQSNCNNKGMSDI